MFSYIYTNGTDVLSCSRRFLIKEILYNLWPGSFIIETTPPPAFLLRLICVYSHMSPPGFPQNHVLNDLKIDQ